MNNQWILGIVLVFVFFVSQADLADENKTICLKCDSSNKNCVQKPSAITEKDTCEGNPKPKCFTCLDSNDMTIRGCNDEVEMECVEVESKKSECGTNSCNDKLYPDDRRKCYQCENCIEIDKDKLLPCLKYDKDDKCFTRVDLVNRKVIRGCQSDEKDKCQANENESECKTCSGNDCNSESKYSEFKCYVCDSGAAGESSSECAQWIDGKIKSEKCIENQDMCYVKIKDDKTIRGCTSKAKTECVESDKMCHMCNSTDCNSGVFPDNRRKCHQCKDCNDITSTNLKSCVTFKEDDECYTVMVNNTINRGCISDDNNDCNSNEKTCVKCNLDECNNQSRTVKPSLSCIKCKEEDEACAWGHYKENATLCEKSRTFYEEEFCYVAMRNNSNSVERGCVHDTEISCLNDDNCTQCKGNGCNVQNTQKFKCYRCRSDNKSDKICRTTTEGLESKSCDHPVTFNNRKCYTEGYKQSVHRGCLEDLMPDFRLKCEKGLTNCVICDGAECNSKELPNKAVTLTSESIIIFITIVFVIINSLYHFE